jgi:hypothetical protein
VIRAIDNAYQKWRPPRPGMHRIKMTMVTRVTRAQLPKPLAAAHRCSGTDDTMYSPTSISTSAALSCSAVRALKIRQRSR